jgi:hypothetical protein
MRTLRAFGLLLLVAILFSSCFKDENPFPGQCKVMRATYYNAGTVADSAIYTYSGDRVVQLKTDLGFYRFFYDTLGLIIKRNLYTVDPVNADKYDTIIYNSNKTIKRIDTYTNLGSAYLLTQRMDFSYTSAAKLSSIVVFDMSSGTSVKTHSYDYVYNYNNIIAVNHTDYTGTSPVGEVFTFSHDGNSNYYKRQNEQAFIIDPFFNDFDPTLLPFAWNANNVTSFSSGNNNIMVVLDLDALHKNVMDVKFMGQLAIHYEYQCQQ